MNAQEHYQHGEESFNRGAFDQAIADFAEANRLDPNIANVKVNLSAAYFNRGVAYFQNGAIDRAIADITEAISFNPNDATSYGALGMMLEKKGDHDGLIKAHTELIRLTPTVDAYFGRGNGYRLKAKAYRIAGDRSNFFKYIDLAIVDMNAALQVTPTNDIERKLHDIAQNMLDSMIHERAERVKTGEYLSMLEQFEAGQVR
jgi:tetratricopeptide (TPR) repeat protein